METNYTESKSLLHSGSKCDENDADYGSTRVLSKHDLLINKGHTDDNHDQQDGWQHTRDAEDTQTCARSLCDPRSAVHRYIALVFICLIGVGDYFANDNPAALQQHFLSDLDISDTKYMGFYSNIMWASIVSCLFGGYLVDKVFKNRLGITLFSLLLTLTHVMFAVGAYIGSYWTMWVARGLYGLAEGPLAIANDNMAVKWFKSRELNMIFGLKTSVARAGSVLAMNVMEPIYVYVSYFTSGHSCLGIALFAGAMVLFVSFLASVVVAVLDKRVDIMTNHNIKNSAPMTHEEDDVIQWTDVKRFPATFWLTCITVNMFYLALFPFVGLGQLFFERKYDRSAHEADNINSHRVFFSMIYLMATILMPIFGLAIDKVGRSLFWMTAGLLLSLTSHGLMAFTFVEPYVPAVCLGVGYSIFTSTMWPMVAYIIKSSHLGTAYGIMNTIIAIGQAVITYLTGYIVDTKGYFVLEVFFTGCMIGAIITGILLYLADNANGGELNLSFKQRTDRNQRLNIHNEDTKETRDNAHSDLTDDGTDLSRDLEESND